MPQDPNPQPTPEPPSDALAGMPSEPKPCAENPEDIADQDLLTQEADTELPPPAIVREGWAANMFRSFAVRDFTLFWSGALLSNVGSWMQNAALVIVVYSFAPQQASLFAGIFQFAAGVPVFFLSIPAGAIADRFDRRRLLIGVQGVLLMQAAALGLLYSFGVLHSSRPLFSLAVVSALGLVGGVFAAFMMPAFQSLLPDLVPRASLMNAIALNSAQFQSSRMLGPMIVSAMVLAGIGMGWVFLANALSFLFVIAALLAVRARHAPEPSAAEALHREADAEKSQLGQVMAGIEYARSDRAVAMLIVSTAMLTIFGFPYMTLLAAIVHSNLGGSIAAVGRAVSVLMALNGFGALVGALAVAGLPATIRRDRVIPYTMFAFAAFVICFALVRSEWAMAVFSTLAGAALMATNSLALTSIQSAVPGHLRGRVMALFVMAFVGIMPFSALLFGPLGQAIGPDRAVLGAGVVLLAWAALLSARPGWLRPRASAGER